MLIHPYWDIAIFETVGLEITRCAALETSEPLAGSEVVVIGHPSKTVEESDLIDHIFGGVADVKRLMPGRYVGVAAELSYGLQVMAGGDDASTLGVDYGASVIDPNSGRLLGVRFVSNYLSRNAFVPAWELARDSEIAKAGVALAGAPQAPAAWTSAWTGVASTRHLLLEAYLARTSGDVVRAQALLGLVPTTGTSQATQIERTILEAACCLGPDPQRAESLLHNLVTETPVDAWPAADRNAVIATRLRLAVDADAEREFLEIVHDLPNVAGLLMQGQFHVLAPPSGNLPWRKANATLLSGAVVQENVSTRGYLAKAFAAAKRIVAAADRCEKLKPWIETFTPPLANFPYLFERGADEARELAAGYVAYPPEIVRPITEFLLDKVDLVPHPTEGWEPIVQPLLMMFREFPGRGGVHFENSRDVVVWLDAHASSGRLGSYLSELFRIDTNVAWQAGLLHLTTPLPIEGLLKRRFSGEKPA